MDGSHWGSTLIRSAGIVLAALGILIPSSGIAQEMPVFQVDPSWPGELPNDWTYGHVPAVAVDSRDHVFLLTRPNTLPPEERPRAAPPVIEFDTDGNFVDAWGGPARYLVPGADGSADIPGFDWPQNEHGIAIDYRNNVWIGGIAPIAAPAGTVNDDMLLKFTRDGQFLLQIGARDASPTSGGQTGGNRHRTSVHQPADVFVHQPTNEAFVADGYGNRRVAVFDAETGEFKRAWGAFGNEPIDIVPGGPVVYNPDAPADGGLDTTGNGSPQFDSPVHSVKVSHDGLVYVADRTNRRVQVFTVGGEYVTQMFLNRAGPASGSAAGLAFSPDPEQRFLYIADYGNSHIAVVERGSLEVLYQFGVRGPEPGNFQGLHHMAVDSQGNIYTGEVAPGARVQKFRFIGMASTPPGNALTAEQLASR